MVNSAIKRKKPSSPTLWLESNSLLLGRTLDFGCGYGFDADYFNLEKYDIYFYPNMPAGKFNTVICIYVLNILSSERRAEIISQIKDKLLKGGCAYFAVRRDIKGQIPGRNCIQRDVYLPFPSIRKTSWYEIYKLTKVSNMFRSVSTLYPNGHKP